MKKDQLKIQAIRAGIANNIAPWSNHQKQLGNNEETGEFIDSIVDIATQIQILSDIQLLSIQSWWHQEKYFYSIVTYDLDPIWSTDNKLKQREQENKHADILIRLMYWVLGWEQPGNIKITSIDERMKQIIFDIS